MLQRHFYTEGFAVYITLFFTSVGSMTHIESLFLSSLADLTKRITDSEEYNILEISALVRKLLIDGAPLVEQVNQEFRLKLMFEISDSRPSLPGEPEPTFWSVQDGLNPETSRPGKPKKLVTRDQPLVSVLAIAGGKAHTLRDIVLFEANVMGGVHAGSPKEEKEKVLHSINSSLAVGGYRGSLRQLQAIGRVVLKGLEPLRAEVVSKHEA